MLQSIGQIQTLDYFSQLKRVKDHDHDPYPHQHQDLRVNPGARQLGCGNNFRKIVVERTMSDSPKLPEHRFNVGDEITWTTKTITTPQPGTIARFRVSASGEPMYRITKSDGKSIDLTDKQVQLVSNSSSSSSSSSAAASAPSPSSIAIGTRVTYVLKKGKPEEKNGTGTVTRVYTKDGNQFCEIDKVDKSSPNPQSMFVSQVTPIAATPFTMPSGPWANIENERKSRKSRKSRKARKYNRRQSRR